MQRLLINRVALSFKYEVPLLLIARKTDEYTLNKNRVSWIKKNLSSRDRDKFNEWIDEQQLNDNDSIATEFKRDLDNDGSDDIFFADLNEDSCRRFEKEIFKQELGHHLQQQEFFIQPQRTALSFSAFQKISEFNENYDQYRRIDFLWKPSRRELSFNFGSEKTLVTKTPENLEEGSFAFDTAKTLVYTCETEICAKTICPLDESRRLSRSPKRFDYKERYKNLNRFAQKYLHNLNSPFFSVERSSLKNVAPSDFHNVYSQQNLMSFGSERTAINAVVGMREFGPFRKAERSEKRRLLFIYQNRNDANTLYRYLKNGYKHFPGLLSYVGIPVALARPDKGLPYNNATQLPEELESFLGEYYAEKLYSDTLAIVLGPFKKYESDEEESKNYYRIKKILLDKGITSQFISPDTLNSSGIHYSLPNIAIAILAKCGGIPWKLTGKKRSELIVGFNTKLVEGNQYIGSAVFFNNEGQLGGIKALPVNDKTAIIASLKSAIERYSNQIQALERIVIHYYKPPRKDEIKDILELLEDMALSIPVAVVEVNDSKSKLDICFDADFGMGMPESGIYVKVGMNEYLLFNNNRYIKNPPRKIDDELPIKLKLNYINTGGFNTHELIAQVYEFSRLNWKGLKQRSVPVTTTYSKFIAEFSSHFDGEIPENDVANNIPWFI